MKPIVINLEHRSDRLEFMNEQARKLQFEFELMKAIPATDNPFVSNGHYGCFLSHKSLLKRRETMLVFEDDCLLNPNWENLLVDAMSELPEDWDMLYLGGWKTQVSPYSEHLQIADRVLCTHAYMIRDKFCDVVLDAMSKRINKIDLLYSSVEGNKFVCNPVIATQVIGYSDIENKITNNDHL